MRLFSHYRAEDLVAHPAFVIRRLLEDGDGADLRWLFSCQSTGVVQHWFSRRAGRQLSLRSRAFWTLVLGREPSATVPGAEELWPL